jgi:hypothetical protein
MRSFIYKAFVPIGLTFYVLRFTSLCRGFGYEGCALCEGWMNEGVYSRLEMQKIIFNRSAVVFYGILIPELTLGAIMIRPLTGSKMTTEWSNIVKNVFSFKPNRKAVQYTSLYL